MLDVTILVVAYRSAADIPALVASVPEAAGTLSWNMIVVDNSHDETLTHAVGQDSRIEVIDAGGNLGYSGGLNLAAENAPPSRFTVFLNPDLVLNPGCLIRLSEACSVGDVVAALPLVLDAAGVPQPSLRREPSTLGSLGEAVFGDHWPTRPQWMAEMVRDESRYREVGPVDWGTGAALMVRSEILPTIGPWDAERFFLYSEETDYSRRIRSHGYQIMFTPSAVVSHRGGGSGQNTALNALLSVNKLRYYRKWHGPVAFSGFWIVAVMHNLLRLRRAEARESLRAFFSSTARESLPFRSAS